MIQMLSSVSPLVPHRYRNAITKAVRSAILTRNQPNIVNVLDVVCFIINQIYDGSPSMGGDISCAARHTASRPASSDAAPESNNGCRTYGNSTWHSLSDNARGADGHTGANRNSRRTATAAPTNDDVGGNTLLSSCLLRSFLGRYAPWGRDNLSYTQSYSNSITTQLLRIQIIFPNIASRNMIENEEVPRHEI